ncbi:chromosome partitioning protein ParA [Vibrio chagasii]|uniref:chromosome partitioning protein ParA n=1 Tax=Vibrio chagasii TaxID=170679 RepID=UPI003DA88CD7
MLTTLVGMISYSWSSKEPETSRPFVEHGGVSDFTEDRPLTISHIDDNRTSISYPTDEAESFDHVVFAELLLDLEGKALFNELDQFWGLCQKTSNCREQLALLQDELPSEWFELLSHYPTLSAEWKSVESTMPLESIETLEERVRVFEQSARQVWGELAHQLFSDQFAHLNFTLNASLIKEVEATEFVSHYQNLLMEWEGQAEVLNADTAAKKYELAISLLPSSLSPTELVSIKRELQETYLDESQANNIVAREQQVAQQQQTVATYHEQFAQLKSSLDVLRSTSHRDWSTQEWDNYYQQQVSSFRESFFK